MCINFLFYRACPGNLQPASVSPVSASPTSTPPVSPVSPSPALPSTELLSPRLTSPPPEEPLQPAINMITIAMTSSGRSAATSGLQCEGILRNLDNFLLRLMICCANHSFFYSSLIDQLQFLCRVTCAISRYL